MPNLENYTRFAGVDLPSLTKEGVRTLVICVAGRFNLPKPGIPCATAPQPTEEQPPPTMEDVYFGKPGTSSLKYEGQTTYYRPGTDIYLTGHAWAPKGHPVGSMLVEVRVGLCRKQVLVFGDRFWRRGLFGAKISRPKPFESMPLVHERAFGGAIERSGENSVEWEPRNPIGCGMHQNLRKALGKPVPNLEDPKKLVSSVRDRPEPQGFGPIPRSWQPRLGYAGTYDEAWINERAPLWPTDFDERFFCAASNGLTTPTYLTGGERVSLTGFSPDGSYEFPVPKLRIYVKAKFRDHQERSLMTIDAIHFEPDMGTFTIIWRAAIQSVAGLHRHVVTTIRELEPWEDVRL